MTLKMRTLTIIFILICEIVFSQEKFKDILMNSKWTLTSGQTRPTVFSADTLTFINSNVYEFHDSIHLKPLLEFFGFCGDYFEFGFNGHFVSKGEFSCTDIQYGYWQLNRPKSTISLQLLEPDGKTDNFKKWTKNQKLTYSILTLTHDKLVLQKK